MKVVGLLIEGAKKAKAAFRTRAKAGQKIIVRCVQDASKILARATKQTTAFKDRKRRLRRAIGARKVKQRRGFVLYKVSADPRKAPHAHLVEGGHKLATSKKRGHRVIGQVPPHPFLGPEFKRRQAQMREIIVGGIRAALKAR